ncbi:MAG TPA: hypothetical protein VK171_08835 [Fimbriimonas sp.]|nr:hypothetical protein [Fimbriimonas sp.]
MYNDKETGVPCESPVVAAANELHNLICDLRSLAIGLESRLEAVLSPMCEEKSVASSQSAAQGCPLRGDLTTKKHQIMDITAILARISNRLEV